MYNLNPNNYNFVVMQLNIRSILSNQLELKRPLNELSQKHSKVDILLLSKTFITSKTENLINMKEYIIHTTNRKEAKAGGTAVLIKKGITHKRRKDFEIMAEKKAESSFLAMIAKNGKKFVVGSLYRARNTIEETFVNYVKDTVHKVKCENGKKEIILGMDHNLNLLNMNQHRGMKHFLDTMLELDMISTITRPTCITNTMATLIDNIFIGGRIQHNYESYLVISEISDHLPSLLLLKQTKVKDRTPIEFESRNLNEEKVKQINIGLQNIDWNGKLNSNNCDTSFNVLCNELRKTMDDVAPTKLIRISGRQRYVEPWLMPGLKRSSQTLRKHYKVSITSGSDNYERDKYRGYRNAYN